MASSIRILFIHDGETYRTTVKKRLRDDDADELIAALSDGNDPEVSEQSDVEAAVDTLDRFFAKHVEAYRIAQAKANTFALEDDTD